MGREGHGLVVDHCCSRSASDIFKDKQRWREGGNLMVKIEAKVKVG